MERKESSMIGRLKENYRKFTKMLYLCVRVYVCVVYKKGDYLTTSQPSSGNNSYAYVRTQLQLRSNG